MTETQIAEVSAEYVVDASLISVPVGYKKTEAGIIPDDWIATTIGDVTSWLSGGTPSRERLDFWQGNIPWISGSTLKTLEISTSDQHLTFEGVSAGSKMAPLNSTLMLVRGSALHSEIRAGLVVEHVCFNQDVKALIPKPDVLPKFLTIYILAMESELLKLVSSAGNSAGVLDTELVKNFKFLKPSISEQTAIANALSDVDALITELEKLIAKKQAIKTATMQQLLTGRTRLSPFALRDDGTPKGYKPSELGDIPEDWEVYSLGQLIKGTQLGGNYKNSEQETGQPLIKMGNLGRGYIKLDKLESVVGKAKEVDRLEFGDILLNTRNTLDLVGKVSVWRNELPVAYFNSNLMRITFNPALIGDNFYMNAVMNSAGFVNALSDIAIGTTSVAAIYSRDLFQLKVSLPIKEEQIAIATILREMDQEIQSLENRLNKTRQIKQGMMQELLTGKTRFVKPSSAA